MSFDAQYLYVEKNMSAGLDWTRHDIVKRSQVQGVTVKMRCQPANAARDTRPPNGGPRLIRSFPYS